MDKLPQILKFQCGCQIDPLNINPYLINLDCPKTWELYEKGYLSGIFQVKSRIGKSYSKKCNPKSIKELSDVISIIRPACLEAKTNGISITDEYVKRKEINYSKNPNYYKLDKNALNDILEDTQYLMLYQEQTILAVQKLAGFSLVQADSMRRAIGKKDTELMSKLEEEFLDGCGKTKLIDNEGAKHLFDNIRKAARYGFNLSHGISYALTSYLSAYLKAHFPLQFYCAWLKTAQSKLDGDWALAELINEAKIYNIKVNIPHFPDLKNTFYIKNDQIYFGLTNIKGIGDAQFGKILNSFKDNDLKKLEWFDIIVKLRGCAASSVVEALINSGSFDYLKIQRKRMLFEYKRYLELTDKENEWLLNNKKTTLKESLVALEPTKKLGGGTSSTKRSEKINTIIKILENPPSNLLDDSTFLLDNEKKYFGTRITAPADLICGTTACLDIVKNKNNIANNQFISICGSIIYLKEIITKSGTKMAFFSIDDGTAILDDICIFSEDYLKSKDLFFKNNKISCSIKKTINKPSYFVIKNSVQQI